MIEVKNLVKKFGDFTALNNISFTLKKGEILGFLGPNGAGKTTTMRILTTFIPFTDGEVKIGDYDIVENPLEARKLIGYLPELPPLYPELRVNEYLYFVANLKGIRENINKRVEEIIDRCGLKEKQNAIIATLSKGYRQRVGLAQALIHKPLLLILDEPTSGLDPKQIVEIRNLIKDFGREHSILLSTHILSEASQLCDRVLIIDHGEIIAEGDQERLKSLVNAKERLLFRVNNKNRMIELIKNKNINYTEDNEWIVVEVDFDDKKRALFFKEIINNNIDIYDIKRETISLEEAFVEIIRRKLKND